MNPADRVADPRWQRLVAKLALLFDELDPDTSPMRLAVTGLSDDRSSGRLVSQLVVYTTAWTQEEGEFVTRRVIKGDVGLTMILEATTVDATVPARYLEDLYEPAVAELRNLTCDGDAGDSRDSGD